MQDHSVFYITRLYAEILRCVSSTVWASLQMSIICNYTCSWHTHTRTRDVCVYVYMYMYIRRHGCVSRQITRNAQKCDHMFTRDVASWKEPRLSDMNNDRPDRLFIFKLLFITYFYSTCSIICTYMQSQRNDVKTIITLERK